jgi:hypothetical protein
MDEKRRINPQNPPRIIRGRKQKKIVPPRIGVVEQSVPATVVPAEAAVLHDGKEDTA